MEELDWRELDVRDTWKKDFTGRIDGVDWIEKIVKEREA